MVVGGGNVMVVMGILCCISVVNVGELVNYWCGVLCDDGCGCKVMGVVGMDYLIGEF